MISIFVVRLADLLRYRQFYLPVTSLLKKRDKEQFFTVKSGVFLKKQAFLVYGGKCRRTLSMNCSPTGMKCLPFIL